MGEYGIIKTEVWVPESDIKREIFEDSGSKYPMNLFYMDIPYMYDNTERGREFMQALADYASD